VFETTIHWVKGIEPHRLGLMARPSGGESLHEEVAAWRKASVGLVVSLLESHEVRELDLKAEPALSAKQGIEFRHFPIPDRGVPQSTRETSILVAELHAGLVQGKAVVIHCRAGIGRTGLVAGCILYKLGIPRTEIFHFLSRSRGLAMPDTSAQVEWVEKFSGTFPNAP